MIKVEVLHYAFGDTGGHVATVSIPDAPTDSQALEYAFERTNSIDDSWWNNDDVESFREHWRQIQGCRSTSVGDVAIVVREDGSKTRYECAMIGWQRKEID